MRKIVQMEFFANFPFETTLLFIVYTDAYYEICMHNCLIRIVCFLILLKAIECASTPTDFFMRIFVHKIAKYPETFREYFI